MPKVKNIKGYYNDETNYRYTVQIKDTYFTNKMIKKSFVYRDNYLHTKQEAEENAIKLSKYLLNMRSKKNVSLKYYLNKIDFIDNSWC